MGGTLIGGSIILLEVRGVYSGTESLFEGEGAVFFGGYSLFLTVFARGVLGV